MWVFQYRTFHLFQQGALWDYISENDQKLNIWFNYVWATQTTHLHFLFGKVPAKVLYPFFYWISYLIHIAILTILDKNTLLGEYGTNIFPSMSYIHFLSSSFPEIEVIHFNIFKCIEYFSIFCKDFVS